MLCGANNWNSECLLLAVIAEWDWLLVSGAVTGCTMCHRKISILFWGGKL